MNNKINPSYKVIADHLRSSVFLIADGILPANEGRGYVLRRIMRRAMRHIHMLGYRNLMMYKLAPTLIKEMGVAFPELKRAENLITETLKIEEEKFQQTLGRGLEILNEELASLTKKSENETEGQDKVYQPVRGYADSIGHRFSGAVAFKLYDTYGFPLDLTEDILKEKGIKVDLGEFASQMNQQKERAKKNWSGSGEKQDASIYFGLKEKLGATEFLGYNTIKSEAKILAILAEGKEVNLVNENNKEVLIILNQTPFYATSGGQKGDDGKLIKNQDFMAISETRKMAESLFVHVVSQIKGQFQVGDQITAAVNENNRASRAINHSVTHLLHFVLKNILGNQVTQKGSNVDAQYLTFDFNHNQPLSDEQLEIIENKVNEFIRQNSEIKTDILPIKEAEKKGAVALFGEKYDDVVRVLSMAKGHEGEDLSVEFCGGTHAKRTGDIGLFKIISSSGIAAGIRRITAVTGSSALKYLKEEEEKAAKEINNLREQLKQKDKEIEKLKKEKLSGNSASLTEEKIGEIKLIHHFFEEVSAKDLRDLITQTKSKKEFENNSVILFFSSFEGKIAVCLAVSKDLISKFDAGKIIPQIVEKIGGKGGGGKADLAFGGGTNKEHIKEAIAFIKKLILN